MDLSGTIIHRIIDSRDERPTSRSCRCLARSLWCAVGCITSALSNDRSSSTICAVYGMRFALVGLLLIADVAAAASMYRYRGPNGEVLFSDRKLDKPGYTLLSHSRQGKYLGKLAAPATPVSRDQINQFIQSAARRYGVDETLISAIVKAESSFNPYAMSK